MDNWKIIARKLFRELTNIAGALLGFPCRVTNVEEGYERELGYTSSDRVIHLNPYHSLLDGMTDAQKQMSMTGVWSHELGHQLFTDFSQMMRFSEMPMREAEFYRTILNICEDTAIENFLKDALSEKYMRCLRFLNAYIYKFHNLGEAKTPLSQVMSALLQFSKFGAIGTFTFQEAKDAFRKAITPYNKLIYEADTEKRFALIMEVAEAIKPLWEADEAEHNNLLEMLNQLGININETNNKPSGNGSNSSGGSNADDKLSRRRKITFQKIKKEEMEEMKKNAAENPVEDDGTSDITVYYTDEEDESKGRGEDGSSMPVPDPSDRGDTSKDSSSPSDAETKMDTSQTSEQSGDESKTSNSSACDNNAVEEAYESAEGGTEEGESENNNGDASEGSTPLKSSTPSANNMFGADNSDEMSGNGGESQQPSATIKSGQSASKGEGISSKSDNSSVKGEKKLDRSDESLQDFDFDEADDLEPFDITEELKLTQEDIPAIEQDIADEIEMHKTEILREQDNSAPLEFDIQSRLFVSKAQCHNYNVGINDSISGYEDLYALCANDISKLSKELKRISKSVCDEILHKTTGKLNPIRLNNGRLSPYVFDKRAEPDKDSFCIFLCIDISGSQCDNIQEIRKAVFTIACACERNKIPLYVMGFTTDNKVVEHYHYIKWKNNKTTRTTLLSLTSKNSNCDGYSIRYATKILEKRSESQKLLLIVTDGCPACSLYGTSKDGIEDTKQAISAANKKVICHGVAIGSADNDVLSAEFGKQRFISVDTASELMKELATLIKRRFKESLKCL